MLGAPPYRGWLEKVTTQENESRMRARVLLLLGLLSLLVAGCSRGTATLPARAVLPTLTATRPPTSVPTAEIVTVTPRRATSATPPPTFAPSPSPSPRPTLPANGQVAAGQDSLRLFDQPGPATWILGNLPASAAVTIIGRTEDGSWLQVVSADGASGWVPGEAIDTSIALDSLAITGEVVLPPTPLPQTAQAVAESSAPPPSSYVSGITNTARQVFQLGQMRGNRAGVFSKVGDSITVATYVLYPFGWDAYDLRQYSAYEAVIDFFSAEDARGGRNSFANISLAADNGWSTTSVLSPASADRSACNPGESPLTCEYRLVRPSVALIMLGTNDVGLMTPQEYAVNLSRIVRISLDMGVIPCLTTIPNRTGYELVVDQFNQIIRDTARQFDVPLVDYFAAMQALPNQGLSSDGVHPSWPPGDDFNASAHFTPANLNYGYTIRNLTALQALDAIWRQVMN